MEPTKTVAHNSGKVLLSNSYITFEELLPVHRQSHDVEQGVSLSLRLGRMKSEDGEIDVFSAEKYFNGDIETEGVRPKLVVPVKNEMESTMSSFSETPYSCSESSINSRGLLLHFASKKNASQSQLTQGIQRRIRRFFDILQRGCLCFSNKSLNVKGNGCSQQTFSGGIEHIQDKSKHDEINYSRAWTDRRMSNDGKTTITSKAGFSSPICRKQNVKDLTMLSLSHCLDSSITSISDDHDDGDCKSESSSELFEIEPFTNQCPNLFQNTSRFSTNQTCNEPSATSFRWSVTTAGAVAFSKRDEESLESLHAKKKKPVPQMIQQSGIFLHYTNDRLVDVSSTAYRLPKKAGVGKSRYVEMSKKTVSDLRKYDEIGKPIAGFELCR